MDLSQKVCVWRGGELGRLRTTTADLCFNYSNGHSFTEGARRPAEYWSHPEMLHLKSQGVHSELTGGSRAPARQGRGLRGAGVPRVDPGELWAQERERGPGHACANRERPQHCHKSSTAGKTPPTICESRKGEEKRKAQLIPGVSGSFPKEEISLQVELNFAKQYN